MNKSPIEMDEMKSLKDRLMENQWVVLVYQLSAPMIFLSLLVVVMDILAPETDGGLYSSNTGSESVVDVISTLIPLALVLVIVAVAISVIARVAE